MRIWITEIGEPLPVEGDVRLLRYGQFTKALARSGHEVIWWTSTFSHVPKIYVEREDKDVVFDDVTLRLVHGPGYKRNISLARIQHNRHFAGRFSELAQQYQKPDLLIATVPTVEIAYSAARYAHETRVPLLIDIRDLWPDELKDLAPAPLRPIAKWLLRNSYRKMKYVCATASGIMGVSKSYMQYGLDFAGRKLCENDSVFPFGYSESVTGLDSEAEAQRLCDEMGLYREAFVVCFFGTIGQYFELDTVIDAARMLSSEFPVQFVLGGDGPKLSYYKKRAREEPSVLFPGWLKRPQISAVMRHSRAGLAPYKSGSKMSLPNKPFEYLAGGLPVISSLGGEFRELLEQHSCGVSYDADSVEDLCKSIRLMRRDEPLRRKMADNAYALWDRDYRSERIFEKLEKHFAEVVERNRV